MLAGTQATAESRLPPMRDLSPISDPVVWVVNPFEQLAVAPVVAAARAGGLGLMPIGPATTPAAFTEAWSTATDRVHRDGLGVLVASTIALNGAEPDGMFHAIAAVPTVVLAAGWAHEPNRLAAAVAALTSPTPDPADIAHTVRRVVVEITSLDEARVAVSAGAHELVAKGNESGGRVGAVSSFVLIQQLAADPAITVPFRVRGGVGLHTAGAAMIAGACGVVLDTQVARCREVRLPPDLTTAISAADGSETVVLGQHRLFTRPDLPVAALEAEQSGSGDLSPLTHQIARSLGSDLRGGYVAFGQDTASAADLADRFVTVGGVIQAVEAAARAALTRAAAARPLAPGAPLATALGTPLAVAQGPMTRVSDRAGFAAAVATEGALPFIALALLRGPEVRTLLEETRDLLGDRAWGVGVLGFVPPDLREEQLEVVREIRPPVALIAGGRPSQAAPLEADGIPTFLHVPSPGLLDRFLSDGARRFVFEGRECGGHIGPRSSFALWDAQITRLLAFADRQSGDPRSSLEGIQVLFAGGIHDERSAAMVAVIGAPLTARGASIGVLMGTAYLFTDAVVTEGAIQPTFQQMAVECDRTALLQTSPGHAIRCAESPFVDVFAQAEQDLIAEGLDRDDRWLRLEDLNLGRLRVASKGLERAGVELRAVDEDRQRVEGLFMLGDVASLRHDVTTVAELHRSVTEGATALVDETARRCAIEDPVPAPEPLDIAIVGMATVLPGAEDLDQFWANVVGGVDSVTEVPAERWNAEQWHATGDAAQPGVTTPSKWGGFVPQVPFDALGYGIPPRSLASIETVQLLALEVASRALADAGYANRPFDRERASVVFGAEAGTDLSAAYAMRASYRTFIGDLPPELDEHLPRLTEDSFPGLLTNVIAGRVANRLDLGGSNFTVDAACASSLAALDIACKELTAGTSDMVLCGGADLHNGIHDYLLFSSVHALSPGGRCRTFDSEADGIALGEGVVCVALKRRADAERDGDHIYGIVRGVAASSDGRHLGLTAPRPEGQERALTRAYDRAGISPAEVGLLEAHGTGTTVGDRTELSTLIDVFAAAGADGQACAVGSVKSNIGHTKCAAGLAGLVKATLAVERGILPPTLHVRTPNSAYDPAGGPFAIYDHARPWTDDRRIAGISAFGFGGTNFHAIVERYQGADEPVHATPRWDAELFVFRGSKSEVADTVTALRQRIAAGPVRLADLAHTVQRRGRGPVRATAVATSVDELGELLGAVERGEEVPDRVLVADGTEPGRVAFVFSGQGSQRPHMLADLFVAFPGLRRHLASGEHLLATLFPPQAFGSEMRQAQRDAVTDTTVAQPALGMVELALAEVLEQCGVVPDLAAGHSYGEVAALAAAGAIPADQLVAVSEQRARAILDAAGDDPGAMAAVSASADDVAAVLDGVEHDVVLANDNAPRQTVISGPTDRVAATVQRLRDKGLSVKELPVACAFHSPVVAGADQTFESYLRTISLRSPRYEVWSNTSAAPHTGNRGDLAAALGAQITSPVRWTEQVTTMWESGARTFVEIGPGRVLGGLVDKILGERTHTTIACDIAGEPGLRRLLLAIARLATLGVPVTLDALFEGRAQVIDLRATPTQPGWTLDGHLVRTAQGPAVSGGLQPITERPTMLSSTAGSLPDSREDLVRQYLDGMSDMVMAQRDVMLALLGADPAAPMERTARRVSAPVAGAIEDRSAIETTAVDGNGAVTAGDQPGSGPSIDLSPEGLLRVVLDLVSDRTGYPLDMLDPGLDLEADLSIDSIKRIEIIGELFDRLPGMSADPTEVADEVVEELAAIKTISGIVAWIGEQVAEHGDASPTPGPNTGSGGPSSAPGASANGSQEDGDALDGRPRVVDPGAAGPAVEDLVELFDLPERALRFEVRWDPAPLTDPPAALPQSVVIVDDGAVGAELVGLLGRAGVVAVVSPDPPVDSEGLTVVDLSPLTGIGPADLLTRVKQAAAATVDRYLVVHPDPAVLGVDISSAGFGGMMRALHRERPSTVWRSIAWHGSDDPAALAEAIGQELGQDGPVTVRRRDQDRWVPTLHPAGEVVPLEPGSFALGSENGAQPVALLTGGAQGITARVALALGDHGYRLELLGRSPLPPPEDPSLAQAESEADLRRALLDAGRRDPRAIEAEVASIGRDRRIRATIDALDAGGVAYRYHEVDVRDAERLAEVVNDIVDLHGRLDLVVHGAGILEDKLIVDKDADSFLRVHQTKVSGASALEALTEEHGTRIVLFGSIAGVFGNKGQIDYASANDALDALAQQHTANSRRVVAIDWGPWAGGGMVGPELEREYARRGIGLVRPDDGVAALLDLVAHHEPPAQTVVMTAWPEAFEPVHGAD